MRVNCILKISLYKICTLHFKKLYVTSRCLKLQVQVQNYFSMTTLNHNLNPPECVYGMKTLDKDLFKKDITVPCLRLTGIKLSNVLPIVKKYLLKIDNFKPIQVVDEAQESLLFLNPERIKSWSDFTTSDKAKLKEYGISEECLQEESKTLKYDNYSAENILKAVLPNDKEGVSSFTKVGHIVHVNLREHLIPFKFLIGEVLFDKVPGCRTVVNKLDMIDNTFRNFKMEILKGENDLVTKVKENKCIFEFDFSKVYWNSRLCTEHERIVNMISSGDVLFDVFAGVGPFSIPTAKKKCTVYANDLNPLSYHWLNHNAKINKIQTDSLKTFNKDGRNFILEEIKLNLPKYLYKNIFIIMNLPAMAVEFLYAFVNMYDEKALENLPNPPTVIVYCFAKGEDCVNIAKSLVCKSIGFDISDKITDIFKVRTVSSMKEMMRVIFKLDKDILTGTILNKNKRGLENSDETNPKKCNYGQETKEDK